VRYRLGDSLDLYVAAKRLAEAHPARAEFYPLAQGVVSGPAPQAMGFAQDGLVLRMTPGKALAKQGGALEGVLVLTSVDGSTQALAVKAFPGAVPDASFPSDGGVGGIAVALLLALLGGLILNLMPCVLPVLAMKAFALSSLSGRDRVEAVRESLAYGAGAILSFLALGGLLLALRSGGAAIGWGFQLQEPLVVALFALLMFGVGLNLSGVFEVAGFGGGDGLTRAGGMAGSFATGILAVAVAAPCTAPFMAEALAFAMYGTAAWLVWVLAQQAGANAVAAVLAAMVAAGFGAWVWGVSRTSSPRGRGFGALITLIAIVAALSCLYLLKSAPVQAASLNVTGIPSQAYSAARLADLRRENRAVFVNATAAWCITCLVNDEAALSRARVRQAFSD